MRKNNHEHYYFRLLHHVNQDDPPKLTDLSKRSITKKSNITKMIDKLVKMDYIERFPDPKDRRITRLRITDDGLKTRNEMIQQEKEFVQEMYKNIPADKLPSYIEMVTQIKGFLEENLGEDGNRKK